MERLFLVFIHLRFFIVFIQISCFECYEYSRILRENVALFTLKKKNLQKVTYTYGNQKRKLW